MPRTTIPCAPSNFAKGRPPGLRPEAIVLHRTGGTADQARVRFQNPDSSMSAHYLVATSGEVTLFVDEPDTAFHAGVVVNGTWKGLKPRVNPNFYTIGIEHEGAPADAVPDDQYAASAALIAGIAGRWDIPLDREHVVMHSEIRASRDCPGSHFDRDEVIQRALLTTTRNAITPASGEVQILQDSNLREGLPSASARIVRVLTAGSTVEVSGFTDHGESMNGSTTWYRTPDGNFFWAGSSSVPQPRAPEESPVQPPPAIASPTSPNATTAPVIGIAQIDQLLADQSAPPVPLAASGRDTLGVLQDLLIGHGFSKLPSVMLNSYGTLTSLTQKALGDFQGANSLPVEPNLSAETLKRLVDLPAMDPRASVAHLALKLAIPTTGMHRILALTAQMEGAGKFAAVNLNTDHAGLSYGLIQWAQSPGRLKDILNAYNTASRDDFVRIFGGGDAGLADGLLAHVRKPGGGVKPRIGDTIDPAFDLVHSPWPERFREAALLPLFQQVQVQVAMEAFQASLVKLRQYDTAALIQSERGVAFMLDVANQFGDGNIHRPSNPKDERGLAALYRRVLRAGMKESDLISGIADATVAAMPEFLKKGVQARRTMFLTTPLLAEDRFSG